MSWAEKSLGELGFVSRGRSRHRPRDAAHLYGGPYPFVQTGDVKHANLYITDYSQTYSEAGLAQSRLWEAGTLCITIAANIADTAILAFDACFPDSIIGFIPHEGEADARFIKYLFDALLQRQYKTFTQGAAQDNLSQSKLLSLRFPIPGVNEQRRIADALSAYDDLIENNRRRIALLEQAARLLYEEWFVRLRFPGHEHVKKIDGVPQGWEQVNVPDIIAISPTEHMLKGTMVRYVPMACLSETGMSINTSEVEWENKATNVKFRNGDTLLARITPCLENGKTAYVNFLDAEELACGSTEFIVLRGRRVSPYFVYSLARTYDFRENAIKSMIGSSGRQRVQATCFNEFGIGLPSKSLLDQFDEFAACCFGMITSLQKQNELLIHARDLLLPRLMNGELAV